MLRDLKFLLVEGSGTIRWATSIGVLAITLVAIGLRPPGNSPPSMNLKAQVPVAAPKQDVPEKLEPLTAKFVPEDATLIAVIRPRVIYSKVENLALSKLLPANMLKPLEMTKDVVQATIVCVPRGEQTMPQLATFLTFSNKEARDRFVAGSSPQGDRWLKTKLMLYEYEVAADGQTARYRPDDLTLVMGQTLAVQKMVLTAGKSLSLLTQTESWKKASNGVLAASASPSVLSDFAPQIEQNPVAGMFSPLWDTAVNHTLGLTMGDRLRIQLMSNSKNSDSAKKIEATMQAAISMFSNMLSSAKKTPDEKSQMTVEALSNLLASHKLEVSGTECRLSLEMDSENFAKFLVEPLAAAKSAGDRAAQTNNVKYIMLALHTYHDAYGSFPAAVVVDPASGMQRSWRVELLPYLDGTVGLYDQYKKNEPWDSPANMDVLAKMPAVFRHPSQPNDSTKTAVTAAYGEGLLFNRTTKGNRISQVLDGTSNTLAILEAKTEIPWTKPEDIEIDCNADKLPDFGGFDETGFIVGYADGSVRYFSKSIDTELLKKLFTIAGGEVIP